MEKIEFKKSLEKTQASLIFVLIIIILMIPTLIKSIPNTQAKISIFFILTLSALIFAKILSLKNKIKSIK